MRARVQPLQRTQPLPEPRPPLWRWRHQKRDGIGPKEGDIVFSCLSPSERWLVVKTWRHASRVRRCEVRRLGSDLVLEWQWSESNESSINSARNDFGGYHFERRCVGKPHPKAQIIQEVS